MPKMKNHKAAAKRYKMTGSGKLIRGQSGRGHLNQKKTSARKRRLNGYTAIGAESIPKVLIEIPYLKYLR